MKKVSSLIFAVFLLAMISSCSNKSTPAPPVDGGGFTKIAFNGTGDMTVARSNFAGAGIGGAAFFAGGSADNG
ncbi:MAG: hypothetical protein ABIN13_09030, partial [Mucilaginibacter sp.]